MRCCSLLFLWCMCSRIQVASPIVEKRKSKITIQVLPCGWIWLVSFFWLFCDGTGNLKWTVCSGVWWGDRVVGCECVDWSEQTPLSWVWQFDAIGASWCCCLQCSGTCGGEHPTTVSLQASFKLTRRRLSGKVAPLKGSTRKSLGKNLIWLKKHPSSSIDYRSCLRVFSLLLQVQLALRGQLEVVPLCPIHLPLSQHSLVREGCKSTSWSSCDHQHWDRQQTSKEFNWQGSHHVLNSTSETPSTKNGMLSCCVAMAVNLLMHLPIYRCVPTYDM